MSRSRILLGTSSQKANGTIRYERVNVCWQDPKEDSLQVDCFTTLQMASFPSQTLDGGDNESIYSRDSVDGGSTVQQQRASLQSIKVDSPNKPDKNALFSSIQETSWTTADHHRLYAMDRLQTRIMEFHNNIHKRGTYKNIQPTDVRPDDVVAFCLSSSPLQSGWSFQPMEKGHLVTTAKKIHATLKGKPNSNVEWIHLIDLCVLPILSEEFDLDDLCCDHFSDLRFHSMMLPVLGGCCLSLCYFQMDPFTLSVGMFKMYFYLTEGLIITFVAELMPELEVNTQNTTSDERDARAMNQLLIQGMPVAIDAVFNAVVDRWETISQRVAKRGPVYVFYQLATEALAAQDTLLEFLSRTIFHFKKKTSFKLPHRKKIKLVKRLYIVNTAIALVESCTARTADVVMKLVDTVNTRNHSHAASSDAAPDLGAGKAFPKNLSIDALVPESILGVRQVPMLMDLHNSFTFAQSCLDQQSKEVRIIGEAIESISQMRADHTALVLSLIATIFLPATFLTGVFGMNFQEHGGYTIEIVNNKYGPLVFYIMCFILAVTMFSYYIKMGWIEGILVVRFLVKSVIGRPAMLRLFGDSFDSYKSDAPRVNASKLVANPALAPTLTPVENGRTVSRSASAERSHEWAEKGISMQEKTSTLPPAQGAAAPGVVRSPLSHQLRRVSGAPASQEGAIVPGQAHRMGHRLSQRPGQPQLVPEILVGALAEEVRREEEAALRRSLAQQQGLHAAAGAMSHLNMRGSSFRASRFSTFA